MKKRVADIIMDILVEQGVRDCFCVVGGGAMHLNNALARCGKIDKYYNHHEQACAMSAEAYVRTSGRLPAVCVTSGPGGTNTLTGVLCAWQDSLPMLILAGQVRYEISVEKSGLPLRQRGEQEFEIEFLDSIVSEAKRPCILVGSGVRVSNTVDMFRKFCDRFAVPVVAGIHVADAHSFEYPLYYGMSGTIGPRVGNFILQNADVIVAVGNSLHLTQTGFNQAEFAPHSRIVMIDIDQNEAMKPGLNIYRFIRSDLKAFFEKYEKTGKGVSASSEWIGYCDHLKERFPIIEIPEDLNMSGPVRQNWFWSIFEKKQPKDGIVAFGNSMGVAGVVQKSILHPDQRLIANFWVGTMGNDIPEAFGAAVAAKREVICCTGDGSAMMNLQELQTIKQYDVPVKIVLFSNQGYGTIRNTCKNFFDGTKVGCDPESGVGMPDFEKVANAFGYNYRRCETNADAEQCIDWLFAADRHAFLEVMQDFDDVYEPKLTSRLLPDNTFATPALHDMAPFIPEEELQKYMLW